MFVFGFPLLLIGPLAFLRWRLPLNIVYFLIPEFLEAIYLVVTEKKKPASVVSKVQDIKEHYLNVAALEAMSTQAWQKSRGCNRSLHYTASETRVFIAVKSITPHRCIF